MAGFNVPNAQGAYMESLIAFGIFGPIIILLLHIKHFILMLKFYIDDKSSDELKFKCFAISTVSFFHIQTSTTVESYILQTNKILVGLIIVLASEISILSGEISNFSRIKTKENLRIADNQGRFI